MSNPTKEKGTRNGHRTHVRRLINEATALVEDYDGQNVNHRRKVKHYKLTLAKKLYKLNWTKELCP